MKAEDKRTFGPKKLKADFEKNIVLKRSFVQARKVKLASILKSGHSERPTEYHLTGHGRAGMGGLNEFLNLGGVAAAEPEQEAHETRGR